MMKCMRCGEEIPSTLYQNVLCVCPLGCDSKKLQAILDSCCGKNRDKENEEKKE